MKSLSRKALISLSLEGLGSAVIHPGSVGELGMPCSSRLDGPMVGMHGIPWNFPLQEDEAWLHSFIKTWRFHVAKGRIQRVQLKNRFSNQQAGSATSSQKQFQASGDLWALAEITRRFATYQSWNKDSCFSILFPVGVAFSKVNLTSGFARTDLMSPLWRFPDIECSLLGFHLLCWFFF